jgi:methylmalonyl-CoA/ethylmalonyl-CoA epimerase
MTLSLKPAFLHSYNLQQKMDKIEHIGIAVKDLDSSCNLYEKLLGVAPYKKEEVPSEDVSTAFFQTGESKIELLASIQGNGPVAAFIEKRGEGIHHIAFAVPDIIAEMARLAAAGFTLLNTEPKPGADNKLVCFVHPKGTAGVLVEICQELRKGL